MAQNGNNDLNEVLRQLAAVTQQLANRPERQSTDPAGDLFKKVAQSKPPTYQGEANPTVLEE
ncbi:Zinc transporter ZIP6 [Bienertia sinuspersici]